VQGTTEVKFIIWAFFDEYNYRYNDSLIKGIGHSLTKENLNARRDVNSGYKLHKLPQVTPYRLTKLPKLLRSSALFFRMKSDQLNALSYKESTTKSLTKSLQQRENMIDPNQMIQSSLQCRRILGARVHIFVLSRHLGFSNCGGLGRGDVRRGSRG